jgi:hypothetical protein
MRRLPRAQRLEVMEAKSSPSQSSRSQRSTSRPPARQRATRITGAEEAARRAATSLTRIIGHPAEGSSDVGRVEDKNWRVCVDVVEVARIPDTTSLMATYEVDLDEDGDLLGYRRLRRYHRGAADS